MLMVARGVVQLIADDKGLQNIQVTLLADEIRDNVERFQNYGFTSVPLPGAEAAVIFVGGNRSHGLAISIDDRRYRLKNLGNGEVAIYTNEDSGTPGHRIHLKNNRKIEIYGDEVTINADTKCVVNTKDAVITAQQNCEITATNVGITARGITANISGNASLNVDGAISLGSGNTVGVARLGDVVTIDTGSSAGTWPITTASEKVKAV